MKVVTNLMTAIYVFGALGATAMADTEVGRIALINGDVRIAKHEADKGRVAKPNDVIFNSDIVKTGDNSAAKILFTDQSLMDVGPASALKVSNYALNNVENRTGTFSILYGKLRALVTKKVGDQGKVEVRSGNAVMGVRGTEFMVDAPRGARAANVPTQVIVVSGLVQVRPPNGGPVINVGAGQMVAASPRAFAAVAAASGGGASQAKADSKGGTQKASASGKGSITSAVATSGSGDAGSGVVMQVSAEQMQAFAGSVTAQDNTFKMATDLNAPSSSGGTTSGSTGPKLALAVEALPPPPPPPSVAPLAPPPPLLPPVQIVPGNQVHLTVNVQ